MITKKEFLEIYDEVFKVSSIAFLNGIVNQSNLKLTHFDGDTRCFDNNFWSKIKEL